MQADPNTGNRMTSGRALVFTMFLAASVFTAPAAPAQEPGGDMPLPAAIDSSNTQASGPAIKPPEAADPMAGISAGDDASDPLAWSGKPGTAPAPSPAPAPKIQPPSSASEMPTPPAAVPAAAPVPAPVPAPVSAPAPAAPAVPELPVAVSPAAPVSAFPAAPAVVPVVTPANETPPPMPPPPVAAPAAKSPPAEAASSIDSRLTALEKRVAELEQKPAAVPAEEKKPKPSPVKKKPSPRKKTGAAGKPSHLVLKAAKPGEAWVAEPGSSEMRTVSVGQTLPGVGRITSIETDAAGRWVISGTQGKISQ